VPGEESSCVGERSDAVLPVGDEESWEGGGGRVGVEEECWDPSREVSS